jgi:osmotically-inducible protein OsmY
MLRKRALSRIGRRLDIVSPVEETLDDGREAGSRDDHSDGRRDRVKGSGRLARAGLGGLLAALLAAPSLAGDADLQRRIEERLAGAALDRKADIRVSVADGAVRLSGIVLSYADYRTAERAARKEARSVVNLLRVVPENARADRAVREDASTRVLRWDRYGPFDAVAIDVQDGVVLLHGWVDSPAKKDEIEERLAGVEGVRDVHNDLRVQGFSVADRRLLQQVYERIYTDPLFERWAGLSDPPIRVFVARGRITLAGLVGSTLEKTAAGNIARATLAFSVTNQLQIEGEARRKEDRKKDKENES